MLTAASLCFCKLLNPSASERQLIPNPLEAKAPLRLCQSPRDKAPLNASLRLCLPRREIDIIVPIVFIVSIISIVSIITIPTILAIPPFPAIGGLFRLTPFRLLFSGRSLSVSFGLTQQKIESQVFDSRLFFFRLTPFRFSLRQKPIRFFRADVTKNREPSV